MHVRLVRVQLSEAGYLVANSLFTFPAREKAKPALELDLLLERNLRAGEQAHRYVWFSHGGKTARDRVVELRRYEFVSDLCGSGRHMVQTVVAHQRKLPAWDSRDGTSVDLELQHPITRHRARLAPRVPVTAAAAAPRRQLALVGLRGRG